MPDRRQTTHTTVSMVECWTDDRRQTTHTTVPMVECRTDDRRQTTHTTVPMVECQTDDGQHIPLFQWLNARQTTEYFPCSRMWLQPTNLRGSRGLQATSGPVNWWSDCITRIHKSSGLLAVGLWPLQQR